MEITGKDAKLTKKEINHKGHKSFQSRMAALRGFRNLCGE
jgi:hypothetical protein